VLETTRESNDSPLEINVDPNVIKLEPLEPLRLNSVETNALKHRLNDSRP
jgi:hypothetical protein